MYIHIAIRVFMSKTMSPESEVRHHKKNNRPMHRIGVFCYFPDVDCFARNNKTIQSNLTILNPPPKHHHPIATSRWSAMAQITIEGFWMRGWIRGWGVSRGWCKKTMG